MLSEYLDKIFHIAHGSVILERSGSSNQYFCNNETQPNPMAHNIYNNNDNEDREPVEDGVFDKDTETGTANPILNKAMPPN